MRKYKTGATRDNKKGKLAYKDFLSEYAIPAYAQYMLDHTIQSDGEKRPPNNWKKGIPLDDYMDSLFRHLIDLWREHEKGGERERRIELGCAVFFNIQGYLHEFIKDKK